MINPKHFKYQIIYCAIEKEDWEKYYAIKKLAVKNDEEKIFLKEFRQEMRIPFYKVKLTHLKTGVTKTWTVQEKKFNLKAGFDPFVEEIRENRKNKRTVLPTLREYAGAKYQLVGGVFASNKEVLALGPKLTINDPLKTKKPLTKAKKYIGIELEFNELPGWTIQKIGEHLAKAGLGRYVSVTLDGSCGFEVRVLIQEHELPILEKIMRLLTDLGFKTDRNCGTHIHLDMRERPVEIIYKNLFYCQFLLRKFLSKNRKVNHFCIKNEHADFYEQKEFQNNRDHRYFGINTLSYDKHGTIEIRMHQGTLEYSVLEPFIKLLLTIVHHQDKLADKVRTLKQAKTAFNLQEPFFNQLKSRIALMKTDGSVVNV